MGDPARRKGPDDPPPAAAPAAPPPAPPPSQAGRRAAEREQWLAALRERAPSDPILAAELARLTGATEPGGDS